MTTAERSTLTRDDLEPLFGLLEGDEPAVVVQTLEAIGAMPIPDMGWSFVGEKVIDLLEERSDLPLLLAAVRVPVREVRERIHDRLAFGSSGDRRRLAEALAEAHDGAGTRLLTRSLHSDDPEEVEAAARALSFVEPVRPETVKEIFETSESDDVRLWLALHLARGGDPEPMMSVLAQAEAGRFDPVLYRGDPAEAKAAIRARAPIPEIVVDLARSHDTGAGILVEHLAAETDAPAPAEIAGPPDAVAIAAAEAIVSRLELEGPPEWSEARVETWEDAAAELVGLERAVPIARLTELVGRVVAEPAPLVAANLVVRLVSHQPEYEPDVEAIHAAYLRFRSAGDMRAVQAAWLASRANLADVLGTAAARLGSDPLPTLDFLTEVAHQAGDPHGPMLGGAGITPTPRPRTELISLERAATRSVDIRDEAGLEGLGLESFGPSPEPSAPTEAPDSQTRDSDDVYALLECPTNTEVGVEFEMAVGISGRPSEGVVGGPLEGLRGREKPYILGLQVVADGFELRTGEKWRHDLAVTADQPYPQVTLHLTPDPQDKPSRLTAISATFSVDGQVVGNAARAVAVVAPGTPPPEVDPELRGADISIPTGPVPPDLTVLLHKADQLHLLRMTMVTPHASVPIPDTDVPVDIGAQPDEFAQNLVREMDELEGSPELRRDLKGRGRPLAASLPDEFWTALRAAADATHGLPSLLLVSAEGRIPWELAVVDPPLDPALPPFLSTQTVMGRWVLEGPSFPPPHDHPFGDMAVVTGDYEDLARWETLQAAFEERDALTSTYSAAPIDATYPALIGLLESDPAPSILHMAVHGKYNPGPGKKGLVLADGTWLTPNGVQAETIAGRPFVFLNACQVGSGSEVLHQYSGLAAAFLTAGASGVIAPLWSVKDEIARDIALGFYAATLDEGVGVGEAIRREREAFAREDGEEPISATFMAYQYFGHPHLRLARAENGGT